MTTTQVFCPSCGTQQPLSEKCIQCGYGFPQQRVNPSELEPTRPIQTVAPKPRPPQVPLPNPAAPEPAPATASPAPAEAPAAADAPATAPAAEGNAAAPAHPHPHPHPHPAPAPKKKTMDPKLVFVLAGGAVVLIILAVVLLRGLFQKPAAAPAGGAAAPDDAQAKIEQLRTERDRTAARTGTWSGKGEGHGRSAEASLSADDDGKIREASVTIHEGDEGILAGFQVEPKAEAMLKELLTGYDPVKRTLEANPSFLRFASWAAPGARTWKAVEGVERIPRKPSASTPDLSMFVDYLVLESTEPDAIIQVGISRKGVVMYLNGSKKFSTEMERGKDLVTKVVRPGQDQEIEHFADLVFNFSGQLNFVSGKVDGAVASPLAPAEGIGLSLAKQP